MFDTSSSGAVELFVLAAGADKAAVRVLTFASLTRVKIALVDVFADALDGVVLVALVANAAVRAGRVFALSVEANVVL